MNTLRVRLILSYLLIIVVTLSSIGITFALLSRTLEERLSRQRVVEMSAPLFTTSSLIGDLVSNGSSVEQIIGRLKAFPDARARRILLLSPVGQVLGDTAGQLVGKRLSDALRIIPPGPGNRSRLAQGEYTTSQGERLLWSALPVRTSQIDSVSATRLWIAMIVPRAEVRPISKELVWALLQAGLVGLGLSVLLAIIIARSISRPLAHVANAAENIAQGHFAEQVTPEGPQDMQRLTQTFNHMARQIERSRIAQRDFVANVSHDLKTPLTSIQGYAQALLDGTAPDKETREHAANVIHDETERMSRLVEDLLELAKIDAGQAINQRGPVNLSDLLQGVVERFHMRAIEAHIVLEGDIAALPNIVGDGDRLVQIFTNLLDNALRHTPAGGKVTVTACTVDGAPTDKVDSASADWIEVGVTDTGPGIPAEDLPRLFERFYQVDKSRGQRSSLGSAGLGLAIVKELTEAHGGKASAESVVGLGTRFIVRLPVVPPLSE